MSKEKGKIIFPSWSLTEKISGENNENGRSTARRDRCSEQAARWSRLNHQWKGVPLVLVLVQLDKRTFVKTISFTTILQEGFICLFKLLAFKLKSFQRMSHEKAIQLFLWLRKTERKPQEWDRYCNLWGWLQHCRISACMKHFQR